jgi:hypothetical protein
MKYFVCTLGGAGEILLGFPSVLAAEFIALRRSQSALFERDKSECFFSMPVLFGKPAVPTVHGIVLKGCRERTIALAPRIDTDMDIPEEAVHPLPALIGDTLPFVRGVAFIGDALILLVNPDTLLEEINSLTEAPL